MHLKVLIYSITVVIPDAESFDGGQLSFITPDGYSAEYKETREYDDEDGSSVTERSVVIKDSEGVVVKEKTLYISSQSDITLIIGCLTYENNM